MLDKDDPSAALVANPYVRYLGADTDGKKDSSTPAMSVVVAPGDKASQTEPQDLNAALERMLANLSGSAEAALLAELERLRQGK